MLSDVDVSRIIEMAWEDRTPFEAIHHNFECLNRSNKLNATEFKKSSFKLWEKGFREGKPNMNNSETKM